MKLILLAIALAGLFVCGCGKSSGPPKVQTIPVTGTIRLDGKPLGNADIVFVPSEGIGGFSARTKDDGSYQLEGITGGKAVCKGKCSVRVSKMLKADGSAPNPDEPPAIAGATESLPERYSSAGLTELSADVPDGGGKFDFDLVSK
jgi:hypothetical protein